MTGNNSKPKLFLALLGIAAITVLAYYPGMSAGFYFDDEPNFLDVAVLHWTEVSGPNIVAAIRDANLRSRPVATKSSFCPAALPARNL